METTAVGSCASVGRSVSVAKERRSAQSEAGGTGRALARRLNHSDIRRSGCRSKRDPVAPASSVQVEAGLAVARPHLTQTFDVPEVESDFIAFCQLTSHALGGQVGTQVGAEVGAGVAAEAERLELLGQVANPVRLPEFDRPDAAREICGSSLLEPLESGIGVEKWIDARSIYARLCATRLLTVPEERSVMQRMHYYKYLAWQILSNEAVSQWDLTRAAGLAKAAMWHRDLILQANMRLVVSIVKRMSVDSSWFEELISDGAVALLRAIDRFDPSRGYRFCTYATPAIRRECYLHIKTRRLDKNQSTEHTALAALAAASGKATASAHLDVESHTSVEFDRAHWLAWRERLAGMMSVLTRREQVIIRSRYCLGSHRQVKTLQRLSVALKISKERVRQLELSALAKLRAAAEVPMESQVRSASRPRGAAAQAGTLAISPRVARG